MKEKKKKKERGGNVTGPKIPRWKLDTEQNRNCLTNCAAGSREEKGSPSRMANERRTCFKEGGSSYGAVYVFTQPAPFPASSNKVLSSKNRVYEYVPRLVFYALLSSSRRLGG